ncbi:HNH endonuclease [Coraliomargarita algicola]|uniref:HNH endonuclease n=1 Tax=Coraliomargarita algicola TaxID=3092156 RepID=A0ABZ0RSQ1_9BACT|nr:HNH endonuclease [Coraliomargarita sp. J2-16]WPJ98093.1 HNH endonuclease [Coraliomargarita sp. J2-16]
MHRDAYKAYLYERNLKTSRKASSYLRALDLLEQMLKREAYSFSDCRDIWSVQSVERLQALYEFVLTEAKLGSKTPWYISGSSSYLEKGHCSAALMSLQEFLVESHYQQEQLETFESHTGDESELAPKLERKLNYPKWLLDGLNPKEGKDVVRSVKTRLDQRTFSDIVFKNYNSTCCVTGLDIPTVNRASHIVGWADPQGKKIRLDPRNGLCLSATYDAAFDRHLISLDDDYRVIISKEIKEHYSSESVQTYFISKEGDAITLPQSYLPQKAYLEFHRKKGNF